MFRDGRSTRRDFLRGVAAGTFALSMLPSGYRMYGMQDLQTLNVGLITDLSGSNQAGGQWLLEGTQLAVDVVNDAGGIGGLYRIELIVEDAKTSTTEGVNAANRLVGRGDISFVVGPMLSNELLAIQPIFAEAQLAHLIVGSTASVLTDQHESAPLSIRYSPQDFNQMAPLAKYAVEARDHKNFFAIAVDNAIGRGAVGAFDPLLTELGGEMVGAEYYPFLNQDFSSLIARFRASGADALIVSDGIPTPAIALLDEFSRQGLDRERLYGSIVFGGPSFFNLAAQTGRADGMVFPWFYDDGSSTREFEGSNPPVEAVAMSEAFQSRLDKLPGPAGFVQAWGWGSVKLLQQAIEGMVATSGADEVSQLDPLTQLPASVIQDYILLGAESDGTGPTFELTFGDEVGFFSCGQGDVLGGPATYVDGARVLLESREWANDIVPDLCS